MNGATPSLVIERIMRSVAPEPNTGCWLWTGWVMPNGYATVNIRKKTMLAHRVSYACHHGAIPQGYEIDHKCRVRCCVNPDHLEAVTKLVNVRRGIAGHQNRSKESCRHGHPYSGANLYVAPNGYRYCRECMRANSRIYERKRRQNV